MSGSRVRTLIESNHRIEAGSSRTGIESSTERKPLKALAQRVLQGNSNSNPVSNLSRTERFEPSNFSPLNSPPKFETVSTHGLCSDAASLSFKALREVAMTLCAEYAPNSVTTTDTESSSPKRAPKGRITGRTAAHLFKRP